MTASGVGRQDCPEDDKQYVPGEMLSSGFMFRPSSEVPQAQLSPEARQRVLDKIDSSTEALRRAEVASRTAVIG